MLCGTCETQCNDLIDNDNYFNGEILTVTMSNTQDTLITLIPTLPNILPRLTLDSEMSIMTVFRLRLAPELDRKFNRAINRPAYNCKQ